MLSLLWFLVFGVLFFGFRDRGFGPAGIVGSVVGAVVVLAVHDRLSGRRAAATGHPARPDR
ncbi:hypothetical protein E9529_14625 [Blastococcus sp. KM273128]|uniref:hypothetical protein n=1 Tax=Blastococcus sp. KM273128 TaxID=2570314 RepID=UPI001F336EC6|nr:hypothetical protein [Blastococcus sp. KM273128]MCF6745482.1 hypothetical protein [Blastococcus sp. KM273128]